MGNPCLIYFLILGGCTLLLGIAGASIPCALKDHGNDQKVCVCNSTYCDTIEGVSKINTGEYVSFISSKEGLRFHKSESEYSPKMFNTSGGLFSAFGDKAVQITVDSSILYQKLAGFGGAFTDAAGINILSLPAAAQAHLLRSYFSEEGIEYNIGKVPIGGTDFSTHPYSYDDGEPDPDLKRFTLTKEDSDYKINLINKAKQLSKKEIRLLTTSWSPPLWMKTNNAWYGSSALKGEYYSTYAKYILRFFDEYKKHNITFWAVTTGNQPMDGVASNAKFNSLGWKTKDLAKWIANDFGPQLRSSPHKDVLLLTFDDERRYLPEYIEKTIKSDPNVYQYIDGFAVHWYLDFIIGDGVIKNLHKEYPDKFVLYTEASNGNLILQKKVDVGSWDRGESYIADIIQNLNAWVVGWVDYNLALSTTGGPNWAGNYVDSPILVNEASGEFYKQPMFYAMGHVSKFIEKDARRVHLEPTDSNGVAATAVKNPDGRVVIVMVNKNNKDTRVSLKADSKGWINVILPKNSFATILS